MFLLRRIVRPDGNAQKSMTAPENRRRPNVAKRAILRIRRAPEYRQVGADSRLSLDHHRTTGFDPKRMLACLIRDAPLSMGR
jgi:hypothetical protein